MGRIDRGADQNEGLNGTLPRALHACALCPEPGCGGAQKQQQIATLVAPAATQGVGLAGFILNPKHAVPTAEAAADRDSAALGRQQHGRQRARTCLPHAGCLREPARGAAAAPAAAAGAPGPCSP